MNIGHKGNMFKIMSSAIIGQLKWIGFWLFANVLGWVWYLQLAARTWNIEYASSNRGFFESLSLFPILLAYSIIDTIWMIQIILHARGKRRWLLGVLWVVTCFLWVVVFRYDLYRFSIAAALSQNVPKGGAIFIL